MIPHKQKEVMGLENGEEVFVSPFDYEKKKEKSA
jgi:hypothetical protein